MEFRNLKIDKLIFHQIYARITKEEIVEPYFSNECVELDLEGKNALKTRVTKSLGNNSHAIKMDINDIEEESVYSVIVSYWNGRQTEEEFIGLSKKLTYMLAKAQNSRLHTGGIVIVLRGTVSRDNKRYICIVKADIQDGFNVEEKDGIQAMRYITNLLLTPAQKLQKIGIFIDDSIKANIIEPNEVETYVYDSNTDKNATLSKAAYFYNDFLGLKFSSDNDMLTNKFYNYTKKFLNECGTLTSSEKNKLQTDLINYISSTGNAKISIDEFADMYVVDGKMNDKYKNFMISCGVPERDIIKDTSLVKLKNRSLKFENSIKLQAPTDEFARNVSISEDTEGNTIVKIRGRLISE